MATKIWAKDAKLKCKQNRDFEFDDLMEEISQWIKIAQQLRLNSSHQTAKIVTVEVTADILPTRRPSRRPTETPADRSHETSPWTSPPPTSLSPSAAQCPICQRTHPIERCPVLAKLDPDAKAIKIRDSGLCFQCLFWPRLARLCQPCYMRLLSSTPSHHPPWSHPPPFSTQPPTLRINALGVRALFSSTNRASDCHAHHRIRSARGRPDWSRHTGGYDRDMTRSHCD